MVLALFLAHSPGVKAQQVTMSQGPGPTTVSSQWLTPVNDRHLVCSITVRYEGHIWASVVISTPDNDYNQSSTGYGQLKVTSLMPSVYDESPWRVRVYWLLRGFGCLS